ncbi:MAG: DUF4197 domain-containing protein [Alphaproteobacteria bacterium]
MKTDTTTRRRFLVLGGAAVCVPTAAMAQSLLDQAKSLLNSATGGSGAGGLSESEIVAALKDALRIGSDAVTSTLGATGGYLDDPAVHIPLPENLQKVQDVLKPLGFGGLGDDVETRMNRAAEAAMPQAKTILTDAVSAMTLDDARGILDGPDDAATQYLERTSGSSIEAALRPIIDETLQEVGAIQALDSMMGQYDSIPFMPDVKANLTDHAAAAALDGLFTYLAVQEADIRKDPARWTTDVLKKVFGS